MSTDDDLATFDRLTKERDALREELTRGLGPLSEGQIPMTPAEAYRAGAEGLDAMTKERDVLKVENERLRKQNTIDVHRTYSYRIDQLQTENDALKAMHQENMQMLEESAIEVERLRVENAALVDRHNRGSHSTASHEAMAYDAVVRERDALKQALHNAIEHCPSCAEWKKECDTLKADLELSRQSLANTGKAYEEAMDEVERLRFIIDVADKNRREIRTRCRIAEQEETRLTAERDALLEKFDQMQQERDSFGHQNAVLRGERDALKETNARLTGMLPTSDYNEVREERDALKAALNQHREDSMVMARAATTREGKEAYEWAAAHIELLGELEER